MSRLAFLFRTDVHVADRAPESWKGDYLGEILSNLEQIGSLASLHQVAAVLDGGDFFHVKAPTRNSHGLVARVSKVHAGYPCPVLSIEGNHDLTYNNLATLERQPLAVLYEAGVFKHLREEVFEAPGLRVRVVGVPFVPDRSLAFLQGLKKQPGDTHLIAVVHALAGSNPPAHVEDFFGEPVFRYQDLASPLGPDVWCFGHWHRDQGIETIGSVWFVNQGAVSRGALIRENLERTPKVALIECLEGRVSATPIPLKVSPAADVFDLVKKERRDKEGEVIDRFVSRIVEDVQFDAAASIEENVERLTFAPEIRGLAYHYLECARVKRK